MFKLLVLLFVNNVLILNIASWGNLYKSTYYNVPNKQVLQSVMNFLFIEMISVKQNLESMENTCVITLIPI